MSKEEIRTQLTPYMHRFKDNTEWRNAFLLYNAVHGTDLKMNCSKCFTKVRDWIKK